MTDFGELPVFEAAATFLMIFICQKGVRTRIRPLIFTQVKTLLPPYPDLTSIVAQTGSELPEGAIARLQMDARFFGCFCFIQADGRRMARVSRRLRVPESCAE